MSPRRISKRAEPVMLAGGRGGKVERRPALGSANGTGRPRGRGAPSGSRPQRHGRGTGEARERLWGRARRALNMIVEEAEGGRRGARAARGMPAALGIGTGEGRGWRLDRAASRETAGQQRGPEAARLECERSQRERAERERREGGSGAGGEAAAAATGSTGSGGGAGGRRE
jgi:hypothetical protein